MAAVYFSQVEIALTRCEGTEEEERDARESVPGSSERFEIERRRGVERQRSLILPLDRNAQVTKHREHSLDFFDARHIMEPDTTPNKERSKEDRNRRILSGADRNLARKRAPAANLKCDTRHSIRNRARIWLHTPHSIYYLSQIFKWRMRPEPVKISMIKTEWTVLTRPVRRMIMMLLIAAFFVIAPVVIGYTIGYRYNWEKKRIEQTGVISIDVEPRDATIVVGGIEILDRPPLRLANRAPGSYFVEIRKPGYHAWKKELSVVSKRTAFIKDVTLLKRSLPTRVLSLAERPVTEFRASSDGRYLLLPRRTRADSPYRSSPLRPRRRLRSR